MTPEEMSTYNQRLAAFTRLLDFVHAGNLPRINEASQLGQDVGGPRTRVWPGDGWCFRAWASGWPKILKQMTRWPGSIFAENINNGVAKTTNDPVKYIHINIYIYYIGLISFQPKSHAMTHHFCWEPRIPVSGVSLPPAVKQRRLRTLGPLDRNSSSSSIWLVTPVNTNKVFMPGNHRPVGFSRGVIPLNYGVFHHPPVTSGC